MCPKGTTSPVGKKAESGTDWTRGRRVSEMFVKEGTDQSLELFLQPINQKSSNVSDALGFILPVSP